MLVVSSTRGEFVDMGRIKAACKTCGIADSSFAVRLYSKERDRYSTSSNAKYSFVKLICQGCAADLRAGRDIERWAIERYTSAAEEVHRAAMTS